jgi:hypothetical protein
MNVTATIEDELAPGKKHKNTGQMTGITPGAKSRLNSQLTALCFTTN